MFEKITVTGPETHPLYQALTAAQPEPRLNDPGFRANLDGFLAKSGGKTNPLPGVLWNFEKFLVNRKARSSRASPRTRSLPIPPSQKASSANLRQRKVQPGSTKTRPGGHRVLYAMSALIFSFAHDPPHGMLSDEFA